MNDREALEFFFRIAVAFDSFGYALFGDKPIAISGFYEWKDSSDIRFDSICSNVQMRDGWETWKKHEHLFPMKNYILVKCENLVDNDFAAILFINKNAFLKTVQENLSDFRSILGDEVSPENLLLKFLECEDVFGEVLKNHEGLIGTLLGYGRNNAWLFHRRKQITSLLENKPYSLNHYSKSLLDELEAINQSLHNFDDREFYYLNFLFMGLPGFVAEPDSQETQQLKKKYENQYHEIMRRYVEKDFLEVTFEQMLK